MDTEAQLVEAVKRAATVRDGRNTIRCVEAFQIAARESASLADIGRICNEQKVRIISCQLGCFK